MWWCLSTTLQTLVRQLGQLQTTYSQTTANTIRFLKSTVSLAEITISITAALLSIVTRAISELTTTCPTRTGSSCGIRRGIFAILPSADAYSAPMDLTSAPTNP